MNIHKHCFKFSLFCGLLLASFSAEAAENEAALFQTQPNFEDLMSGMKNSALRSRKPQTFTHSITFDTVDISNTAQDHPFVLPLTIEVIGQLVNIHIPSFNFTLPGPNEDLAIEGGGAVYTQSGFLPQSLWPADLVPQAFDLKADQAGVEYSLLVTNSGSILVYNFDGTFLPSGNFTTHATTISYLLTERCHPCKAPENIRLTSETSNAAIITYAGEFLEFYHNSIVDNRFANCWPSNTVSTSPNGRDHFDLVVQTGTVHNKKVKLNDIVTALKAPHELFYFLEASVTIDPFNLDHLVVVATGIERSIPPTDPNRFQLWRSVSFDNGKTWDAARLDGTFGLPNIPRDGPDVIFDDFGNLWVPYIYATSITSNTNPVNIVFALSTDGGLTWKNAGGVIAPTILPQVPGSLSIFDYLRASFGGDGKGGKGLWSASTYYTDDETSPYFYSSEVLVTFMPVTGLGQFGSITKQFLSPTAFPAGGYPGTVGPEIVASATGKVYLLGNQFDTPSNSNHIYLLVNPTGIVDLGPDSFVGPRVAAFTNIGKADTVIPFAPRRGIPNHSTIAYDPALNRLYFGLVDMRPDFSNNMTLTLVHTDDDGLTWSTERPIANKTKKARGILNLARDPVRGTLLFSWFDSRGQKDQSNVNTFMSILTQKQLNK